MEMMSGKIMVMVPEEPASELVFWLSISKYTRGHRLTSRLTPF